MALKMWAKRTIWIVIGLAVAAALVWAWRPRPVPVDVDVARRGPMAVTVDEDGITRVRDRYVVSAPVTGVLERISLDEGERVEAAQTVAWIAPITPPLLDLRSREQAEARVAAARANVRLAEATLAEARQAFGYAETEEERQRALLESGVATSQAADQARFTLESRRASLDSARFAVDVARHELAIARSALSRADAGEKPGDDERIAVTTPVDGTVLHVLREDAGLVQAGAPLLEVGQLDALEIVVDVLTTEAVKIAVGDPVEIFHWGGEDPLRGRVRLVEPSAFTRTSSLGVEEQRVNVVIDLHSPPQAWRSLGDRFRVEARVVTWQADDVLSVDASAVFRSGDGWAAYRIVDEEVVLAPVRLGHRNPQHVEVLDGLNPGDVVITFPGDAIEPGVAVEAR